MPSRALGTHLASTGATMGRSSARGGSVASRVRKRPRAATRAHTRATGQKTTAQPVIIDLFVEDREEDSSPVAQQPVTTVAALAVLTAPTPPPWADLSLIPMLMICSELTRTPGLNTKFMKDRTIITTARRDYYWGIAYNVCRAWRAMVDQILYDFAAAERPSLESNFPGDPLIFQVVAGASF